MIRREFDIASLIAKSLAGTISEEERVLLEAWKGENPAHLHLFEKISSPENFACRNIRTERYQGEKYWEEVEFRINRRRLLLTRRFLSYAALLITLMTVSYFLLQEVKQEVEVKASAQFIRPGTFKALLVMANGDTVALKVDSTFTIKEADGTLISKDSAILNYWAGNDEKAAVKEALYHTIKTPLGGEYFLVLSDGSRVHLNAMSSLRFPVRFTQERREVELTGEAYFEVEKDSSPFVVTAGETATEVLGTEFNISAYPEEKEVKTTLINGRVRFTAKGENVSCVLKPSEQVGFNIISGKIKLQHVDVADFIAWKDGLFRFKDWRLEEIMEQLARWYDMKVEFQDEEVKDIRFGCCFNRYREITPILELLEETCKVGVKVEGNTVILTKTNTKTK